MRKFLLLLIYIYQCSVLPYNRGKCRFSPTCSAYAYQAIQRFGALKGSILSLKRFLKCNPFYTKFGLDPVPEFYKSNHELRT